ncbi:MAG TPA: hypothetical protein VJ860_22235 [Polyangia bacterium]|jgi:Putative transmembrane protein (PGPGW).|nr:hypothetical protein [Polyangia bacterium]
MGTLKGFAPGAEPAGSPREFRRPAGLVRQNTLVIDLYHRVVRAYVGLGWPAGVALTVVVPTLTFLFGVAVVLWLPSDYFVRARAEVGGFGHRHTVVRMTVRILKNALGWFMVPMGIFMALPLVPGPGLVFILIGISLLDFSGKRRMEERLLAYPPVLHAVNRMRQRFRRSPVLVHPTGSASGKGESPAKDEPPASGG